MSYEMVLQSEAILDIQEAFEWYEEHESGLGFEFIRN
jgi:toxin ParE1/3/4